MRERWSTTSGEGGEHDDVSMTGLRCSAVGLISQQVAHARMTATRLSAALSE